MEQPRQGIRDDPGETTLWLAVTEGLDLAGCPDTVAGRRRFIERLDGFIRSEGGDSEAEGVPLSKLFERGWFWGSEAFRERLATRIEKLGSRKSRDYRSRKEGPSKDHGIKRAGAIIAEACGHYAMDGAALKMDRRGDWRRSSVAWAVAKETSVPHEWIAAQLNLKSDPFFPFFVDELSYEKIYDALAIHHQAAKRWEELLTFAPFMKHVEGDKRKRKSPVTPRTLGLG